MHGNAGYQWVALNLEDQQQLIDLPKGAVVAGHEHGSPTYVARVCKDQHWELGKLNAWARFAFSWYGKEYEVTEGQVLVAIGEHEAVWINGAFGEHVEGVATSRAVEGEQSVGRAWHQGRWIPGKVVHFCYCLFCPFGGQELRVTKYQLLSSDYVWLPSSKVQAGAVGVADPSSAHGNVTWTSQDGAIEMTLTTTTSVRDWMWVISGEGEYVRHGIAFPDGSIVGRAWVEGSSGGSWAVGKVCPPTHAGRDGGIWIDGALHSNYHVLTASPRKQAPQLLSVAISDPETIARLKNAEDQPSKEIFMVTQLRSGEQPWAAVREMLCDSEDRAMQPEVKEHLQPMLPLLKHLGKAEREGTKEAQLPGAPECQASAPFDETPGSSELLPGFPCMAINILDEPQMPAAIDDGKPVEYPALFEGL